MSFFYDSTSGNQYLRNLNNFFDTPLGKELEWLKYEIAWDKNGEFAEMLSVGGIPLTILVDKNGIVRLNEAAAFLKEDDLMRLKTEISKLLN